VVIKKVSGFSVVILNKSEYLAYRDFKNFRNCIEECGIPCFYNNVVPNSISFLDAKNFKILSSSRKAEI